MLTLKTQTSPRIVEIATGRIAFESELKSDLHRMAWSGDGRRLVCTYSSSEIVHLFDLHRPTEQPLSLQQPFGIADSVAISGDGQRVVVGMRNGGIVTWDLSNRTAATTDAETDPESDENQAELSLQQAQSQVLHRGMVKEIAIDAEGRIVSGGEDGSVVLSSFSRQDSSVRLPEQKVIRAVLAPDGRTAWLGCVDLSTMAVDVLGTPDPSAFVCSLAVSADGRWLGYGQSNGVSKVVSLHQPAVTYEITGPRPEDPAKAIAGIIFNERSDHVLVSSRSGYRL